MVGDETENNWSPGEELLHAEEQLAELQAAQPVAHEFQPLGSQEESVMGCRPAVQAQGSWVKGKGLAMQVDPELPAQTTKKLAYWL